MTMTKKTREKKSVAMKKYWAEKKKGNSVKKVTTKKSKTTTTKKTVKKLTWREFITGKMSKYMKSEGSHAGAMKRLSKEWKSYNK